MGEYATYNGSRVKLGTCEDMYYLRADQADKVRAVGEGETDPIKYASAIRFRFPFPDEDDHEPGNYDEPFRSLGLYVDAADIPTFEHHSVQFTSRVGYILSIPCPETNGNPLHVGKNGWVGGTARIVQQRVWSGRLVLIADCPGCEAKYRLETWDMVQPYIIAARAEADRAQKRANVSIYGAQSEDSTVKFWHTIADRIAAGYTNPPKWVRERVDA